jgi:hypothetical protein
MRQKQKYQDDDHDHDHPSPSQYSNDCKKHGQKMLVIGQEFTSVGQRDFMIGAIKT